MKLPVAFNVGDSDVYCELEQPDSEARAYKRRGVRLLFLTSVYTAPSLRNEGLAGALLAVVFAWAKANRIDICTYARSHPRGRSKAPSTWDLMFWYQRQGFRCVKLAYNDPQEWMVWRHDQPRKNFDSSVISKKMRVPEPSKNSVYSV